MNPKDDGITAAVLLQHIQGMEGRIITRIDGLETKVDSLATKVDTLEITADQNHAQTMNALDNIDARVDDIEVVQVPTLRKAVGI